MKNLFFLLLLSAISLSLCSSESRVSLFSLEDGTGTSCNLRRTSLEPPSYSLDADVDNYAHDQAARLCRKVGKPQIGPLFNVAQDFYKRNMPPTCARAIRIDEPVDGLYFPSSPRSRDEEEDNTSLLTLMLEQQAKQYELEKQRLQLEKEAADGAHIEWVAERKTQQKQWEEERQSSARRFQAAQKQTFRTNLMWGTTTICSLLVTAGSWIWGK